MGSFRNILVLLIGFIVGDVLLGSLFHDAGYFISTVLPLYLMSGVIIYFASFFFKPLQVRPFSSLFMIAIFTFVGFIFNLFLNPFYSALVPQLLLFTSLLNGVVIIGIGEMVLFLLEIVGLPTRNL